MSVLVYTESEQGKFKKIAQEAVSYAKGIADMMGTTVTAVSVNGEDTASLGNYGASKVLEVNNDALKNFNAEAYADVVAKAAQQEGAQVVVLSSSANGKYISFISTRNITSTSIRRN